MVRQGLQCVGDAVFGSRQVHVFADDHAAFADLPCEHAVGVGHERADDQSDDESDDGEQQQVDDVLQPVAVVEASDGFAKRFDRIVEREERVERAEELRHHLDGVEA